MWESQKAKDYIRGFRGSRLRLDLPRMRVCQCTTRAPIVMHGAGVIWQRDDGIFELSFFPGGPPTQPRPLVDFVRSGDIFPRRCFYRVTGIDASGIKWRARWLLPKMEGGEHPIIRGQLRELECSERSHGFEHQLEMSLLEKIEIPCTTSTTTNTKSASGHEIRSSILNGVRIEHSGVRITITTSDTDFTLEAASSGPLPPRFQKRVSEALQFVLGRHLMWSLVVRTRRSARFVSFRSRVRPDHKPRLHPPIPLTTHRYVDHVWRLFRCYLAVIGSYTGRGWHPISEQLYHVIEASDGSPDAFGLTLGSAVEGIAQIAFGHLAKPPAALRSDVEAVRAHLRRWDGFAAKTASSETLRKRLDGLLGTILRPNVNEIFSKLLSDDLVDVRQIEAWKELRHPRAHGKLTEPGEIEQQIYRADSVTTLMYRLIFTFVGYSGPFVDFGIRGWPEKQHSPMKHNPITTATVHTER